MASCQTGGGKEAARVISRRCADNGADDGANAGADDADAHVFAILCAPIHKKVDKWTSEKIVKEAEVTGENVQENEGEREIEPKAVVRSERIQTDVSEIAMDMQDPILLESVQKDEGKGTIAQEVETKFMKKLEARTLHADEDNDGLMRRRKTAVGFAVDAQVVVDGQISEEVVEEASSPQQTPPLQEESDRKR